MSQRKHATVPDGRQPSGQNNIEKRIKRRSQLQMKVTARLVGYHLKMKPRNKGNDYTVLTKKTLLFLQQYYYISVHVHVGVVVM